jgi:hypothetical protein
MFVINALLLWGAKYFIRKINLKLVTSLGRLQEVSILQDCTRCWQILIPAVWVNMSFPFPHVSSRNGQIRNVWTQALQTWGSYLYSRNTNFEGRSHIKNSKLRYNTLHCFG